MSEIQEVSYGRVPVDLMTMDEDARKAITNLIVAADEPDNTVALALLQNTEKYLQTQIRRRIHAGANY